MGIVLILGYVLYTSFFSTKNIANIINENKEYYSIILSEDDKILININPDKSRPLASVVKLIVAIEFSEQIAARQLNNNELVELEEIGRYYVSNTDGNAHKDWLSYMKEKQKISEGNLVSLRDVAIGMMAFSSNANTEYLLDRLGIDRVNERIAKLGFEKHSPINYLVSEMYLSADDLNDKSDSELYEQTKIIHEKLKTKKLLSDSFDYEHDSSLDKQKLLSDRLTHSTAMEYYELMKKISSNQYFSAAVQTELNSIIERKSQLDKYNIVRMGSKGGSTLWILNYACYLERKNGKKYKLVLFSNYPNNDNHNLLVTKMFWKFITEITDDTKRAQKLIKIINK